MTSGPTTETRRFDVATLDELLPVDEAPGRKRMQVRKHFGIAAFGCNAYRADAATDVIAEHDEVGAASGGHEELYLVVSGHATFTVDGEEIDAPAGALVFVRDPAAKRKALALEPATTVLAVGNTPGEAFVPSPWEAVVDMFSPYRAGDYERAAEIIREALVEHPGNPAVLYNLACCESLLGQTEAAFEHLREAAADERYRTHARTDSDFDAIREDPRFREIVGEGD